MTLADRSMSLTFLAHREKENTEVLALDQFALGWPQLGSVATAGINPRGSLVWRCDRCAVVVHTVSADICGWKRFASVVPMFSPSRPCYPIVA